MGFYCESCGEKVKASSGACPRCGVRFQAVKCPRCDFSGEAGLFRKGCPSCGYLASSPSDRSGEEEFRRPRRLLKDRVFWLLGGILLIALPFLLILLSRA